MKLLEENKAENEIIVMEKKQLMKVMNELSKNQRKILSYLMEMKKENGMMKFDRQKIATNLDLSVHTVSRAVSVFQKLNIIGMKHEERYEILI